MKPLRRRTLQSLGLIGAKSSGTCFLISSGCPPSTSQKPGSSWFCMRIVISAFPLRSFLLIFSANNLRTFKCQLRFCILVFLVFNSNLSFANQVAETFVLICVPPGLCGAAESRVGSSPDKDLQPCVQQEDKPATKKKDSVLRTQCSSSECVLLKGVANYAGRVCESYLGSREEAFKGTDSSLMFFLP